MAQIKISQLEELTSVSDNDVFASVDTANSKTKKTKASTLKKYVKENLNYSEVAGKPSINGTELLGDKSLQDLGIQPAGDYALNSALKSYSLVTETGNKISLTINSSTYVMTLQLKDKNGSVLSTGTIDLPLETMVVGASYNADTQEIELTLKNGSKVSFSVSDLVKGLVSQDTLNSTLQDYALKTSIPTKLSQLTDDSAHRLVTDTEKATWNNKVDKVDGKGLSTNDFTNELKSKLDGIEDNAQVNKIEKISLDGVEQEIVEKEVNINSYDINKYFYNALTYNQAKGNDLTFEDSIEFPLGKLDMDGKSEQDLSKMTYKCNGTENGDYYFTYEDTNYQFTMPSVTSSSILVFDTSTLKLSINDEEITTSNNNTGTLIELLASPNPDYPQEINSIEGDLEFYDYGSKNIFDENWTQGYFINNEGNANTSNVGGRGTNKYYTGTSKKIYLSFNVKKNILLGRLWLQQFDKDKNGIVKTSTGIYDSQLTTGVHSYEINLDENTRYVSPSFYSIKDGDTVIYFENFQDYIDKVCISTTSTEYVPYKGRTLTIPTNGQVFRKIDDVADKLVIDMKTGDYYKEENIGEIVLNGSENWRLDPVQEGKTYRSFYTSSTFVKQTKCISNKLVFNNLVYYIDAQGMYINQNSSLRIKIFDETLNSISSLRTYLEENNIIVNGILKTPTLEKIGTLTKEQLDMLVTFKGYNNVMINTNLGQADIDIEYVLDMKKYIDNKIAEISAQMI